METDYTWLIDVLEKSIEKNGEIPLTNKHLLNILKMAERMAEQEDNYTNMDYNPYYD
jgi:antitoxin component HigA of HigAB toxin-antitoxin module